ncbi:hypothetical protein TVAG_403360 [Trichomonas vaginalis G3]|uniref:Proteasome assembly chaperone 1 n=1 Tax=Trichomonas vaginalis (strain ATCC PRA-98 / G3) TaxID=412133 RepID=A2F8X2_TRIV3|nr:hypothetical protein TVAGG3_0689080 [Trichomonas vaginalis G3]EAX98654.1 hypothetical protein TVAG_403360 [Trichomonas vaginalis G3]KAI5508432.1 hypothetical protein TVAGG3_0689080 [Trichomonas vaginalis G3]|eukprot:XP_001311584.1 hypothetical protein [Trichomonas vaginalis G3]
MSSSVFTAVDISSEDHSFESIKYIGKDCKSSICLCAVSTESSALFSAITNELNPIGFFLADISDISNPIEYANGIEPKLMFLRSFRNEVFKIGDITLVNFSNYAVCHQELAQLLIDTISPKSIYVFNTISLTDTSKNSDDISFTEFTNMKNASEEEKYKIPKLVKGISASIITYSFIQQELQYKVSILETKRKTISQEDFKVWTKIILDIIEDDKKKNNSVTPNLTSEDVINLSHHNLLLSQNITLPQ